MASQSAYGANPHAGVNPNGDHGWGGYQWPGGVPASLLGVATYDDIRVTVRKELVPLFELAFAIAKNVHGYKIYTRNPNGNGEVWGPWSYENRTIGGGSTPSNHSKGKAVDINAPMNPYAQGARFESNFPVGMVRDFEAIGFYWGGRYGDAMHFEYAGTPAEVAGHVAKAKQVLGNTTPVQPEDDSMSAAEVADIKRYIDAAITSLKDGAGHSGLEIAVKIDGIEDRLGQKIELVRSSLGEKADAAKRATEVRLDQVINALPKA